MSISFKREPAAWVGAIQTTVAALSGIGLVRLTNEQQGLLLAAVTAIGALVIRANVYSPVNKAGQPIIVVHPEPDFTPVRDETPRVAEEEHERREAPRHKTDAELLDDYKNRTKR